MKKISAGNSHTAPSEGLGGLLSEAPLGLSQPHEKLTCHPQSRDPKPEGHCLSVCPGDDARVPTKCPARFTAERGKPSRLLPGSRNVMFWLLVKGPVYWKHTSFPMFGFLSLFSLFCFFPECTAQGLRKGY